VATPVKNKQKRQAEAAERNEKYSNLTTAEKIARLDKTLGKGVGATKQRAKLAKQLEAEKKKEEK